MRNHSWCCCVGNAKLTYPSSVLNHWSKSQTYSCGIFLISFSLMMHYDYNFGFLNSFFNSSLISCMVFGCCVLVENFINHVRALSLNVVSNCAFLVSLFCTCLMFHIASHRKKCWSRSSMPMPRKTGNLISSPILFLCKGGFCYVLEELGYYGCAQGKLVCYVCTLTGYSWPPPGICNVRT